MKLTAVLFPEKWQNLEDSKNSIERNRKTCNFINKGKKSDLTPSRFGLTPVGTYPNM